MGIKNIYPTQSQLKELFDYSPETGILTWKVKSANRVKIGDIVGFHDLQGYVRVRSNNIVYLGHRIIWIWNNGDIPDGYHIDHINGIRNDNRLCNLRLVTRSQNAMNKMGVKKQCPTQAELKELFDYNHDTGNLIWKVKSANRVKIGDIVGTLNSGGYINISIHSTIYLGHRLIWIWNKGDIPDGYTIDHLNGITTDNRLSNLRLATRSQNCQNTNTHKDNKTGIKGLNEWVDKKTGNSYWFGSVSTKQFRKSNTFPFTESNRESQKLLAIEWLEQTRTELHKEFTNHGS